MLLSISDICEKLSISVSTLARLRSGKIENCAKFPNPSIVYGRSPRWNVSCLNEWFTVSQKKQGLIQ